MGPKVRNLEAAEAERRLNEVLQPRDEPGRSDVQGERYEEAAAEQRALEGKYVGPGK